jgi:sterol desaturase/sphingolipid hydroxylase (fatty acid hydroxylase superfamily)
MILTAQAISLVYQFWIHTELIGKLGPVEWIMNTPSHHRVHHGSNTEYLDRNYAGIFIVWDRWFGSFEPERTPVDYGLTKNINTFNPLRIAFHDWAAMFRSVANAGTWREALGFVFRRPGWSPDGSTLTARQMQQRLAAS